MTTFTLSIEPLDGRTFQHGFHLGTDEALARKIAVETFNGRNEAAAKTAYDHRDRMFATRTVALIRGGTLVDVYDGECWHSEIEFCDGDLDAEPDSIAERLREADEWLLQSAY